MIHLTFEREVPGRRLLLGDVLIAEGPPPRSAVVVVHGFKGFKDWGFFPHVARRLAAAGHAAVVFNFSGAGVGRDTEHFADLDGFARNTLSRELD
ncbi:MAG TPA: alpha/beta hydrolase, partial [Candidatus Thermoplasmatota archaeon]